MKEIMVRAHKLAKEMVGDYRARLKMALIIVWAEVKKANNSVIIKEWFENKISSELNGGFLVEINYIEKETEKAYLFNMTWGYTSSLERTVTKWVPKSATMTVKEYKEECAKIYSKSQDGLKYNELLLSLAKENGVKGVRKGMKTQTLIKKMSHLGIEIPARS